MTHIDGTQTRCDLCGEESSPHNPVDTSDGVWFCRDGFACNDRHERQRAEAWAPRETSTEADPDA